MFSNKIRPLSKGILLKRDSHRSRLADIRLGVNEKTLNNEECKN